MLIPTFGLLLVLLANLLLGTLGMMVDVVQRGAGRGRHWEAAPVLFALLPLALMAYVFADGNTPWFARDAWVGQLRHFLWIHLPLASHTAGTAMAIGAIGLTISRLLRVDIEPHWVRGSAGVGGLAVVAVGLFLLDADGAFVFSPALTASALVWASLHRAGDPRLATTRRLALPLLTAGAALLALTAASQSDVPLLWIILSGIAGLAWLVVTRHVWTVSLSLGVVLASVVGTLVATERADTHAAIRLGLEVPVAVDLVGGQRVRYPKTRPACLALSDGRVVSALDMKLDCPGPVNRWSPTSANLVPNAGVAHSYAAPNETLSAHVYIHPDLMVRTGPVDDPASYRTAGHAPHFASRKFLVIEHKRFEKFEVAGLGSLTAKELHSELTKIPSPGVVICRHPSMTVQDFVSICESSAPCRLEKAGECRRSVP